MKSEILAHGTAYEADGWSFFHGARDLLSASQGAAALNADKYTSLFALYQRKVGALPWPEPSIAMRRGHALEALVAQLYEEATGRKTHDPGDYTIWQHQKHPWLFCTPDRFTKYARLVELKTASPYLMDEWQDGVPERYWIQAQIQLQCVGVTKADVACLVGDTFVLHEVERDQKWFEDALPKLAEFRRRCMDQDPPPLEPRRDADIFRDLHPDDNGETVQAPELESHFHELIHLKKLKKDADADVLACEAQVKAAMGDNTFLEAARFTATWRTVESRGNKLRRFTVKEKRG